MKKIKTALFLFFGVFIPNIVFAETDSIQLPELKSGLDKVVGFFTSDIMKVIFSIALGGLLVGFGLNRENPELKKRFLFWAISIGGLLGLSTITGIFFTEGMLF